MNGSIEAFCGGLGSGKTSSVVELGMMHLLRGGTWYANIEVFRERGQVPSSPCEIMKYVAEWMADQGVKYDPSRFVFLVGDLSEFHSQIKRGTSRLPVMVSIDEASLDFNSRDWSDTSRDLLAFFNFARKLDVLLYFISQSFEDMDKQLRKRFAVLHVCDNMKGYKIWGVIPFPIPVYVRKHYKVSGGSAGAVKISHMNSDILLKPWSIGYYNSDALTGKGHEQFLGLETADTSGLEKISRQTRPSYALPLFLASLCSALFSQF